MDIISFVQSFHLIRVDAAVLVLESELEPELLSLQIFFHTHTAMIPLSMVFDC